MWNFDLTRGQENDLERVQKIACKIILQESYSSYEAALKKLNLDSLKDRRNALCLKFAQKCLKNDKTKSMFPLSEENHHYTRIQEKFKVKHANTDRLKNSAIPQMQRLLNTS